MSQYFQEKGKTNSYNELRLKVFFLYICYPVTITGLRAYENLHWFLSTYSLFPNSTKRNMQLFYENNFLTGFGIFLLQRISIEYQKWSIYIKKWI